MKEYVPRGTRIRRTYEQAVARNRNEELSAKEFRETYPIEQAKRFLRQRGYIVTEATVFGGEAGRYRVGNSTDPHTADDLIGRAARLGHKPSIERMNNGEKS